MILDACFLNAAGSGSQSGTGASETRKQIGRHRHWRVEGPASGAETLLAAEEDRLPLSSIREFPR